MIHQNPKHVTRYEL